MKAKNAQRRHFAAENRRKMSYASCSVQPNHRSGPSSRGAIGDVTRRAKLTEAERLFAVAAIAIGYRYPDVAKALGCSVHTLPDLLARERGALHARMDEAMGRGVHASH